MLRGKLGLIFSLAIFYDNVRIRSSDIINMMRFNIFLVIFSTMQKM